MHYVSREFHADIQVNTSRVVLTLISCSLRYENGIDLLCNCVIGSAITVLRISSASYSESLSAGLITRHAADLITKVK